MPNDYFSQVGQQVCAMLAKDPAARERVRSFADGALGRHLAGPMAADGMPISAIGDRTMRRRYARDQEEDMPPRGYSPGNGDPEDQNGGDPDDNGDQPLDADQIMVALRQALDVLDPGERGKLLASLQMLCESQDAPNAGGGSMDARRVRSRAAMDAAFRPRASFADRWPQAARVTVMGVR